MDIDLKITYKSEALKNTRNDRGITQAALSEATGISLRTLQHYEQGAKDINAAKLSTILKICIALQCEVGDIISDPETRALLGRYERRNDSDQ